MKTSEQFLIRGLGDVATEFLDYLLVRSLNLKTCLFVWDQLILSDFTVQTKIFVCCLIVLREKLLKCSSPVKFAAVWFSSAPHIDVFELQKVFSTHFAEDVVLNNESFRISSLPNESVDKSNLSVAQPLSDQKDTKAHLRAPELSPVKSPLTEKKIRTKFYSGIVGSMLTELHRMVSSEKQSK